MENLHNFYTIYFGCAGLNRINLTEVTAKSQLDSRGALTAIVSSVAFLAKQGLALRGHDDDEGNFLQLLQLRSEDNPKLKAFIAQKESYTSPQIQK